MHLMFFIVMFISLNTILAGEIKISISTGNTFAALLAEEDTDHNNQITIDDVSDKRFNLVSLDGQIYEIAGTYQLSNLLQELAIAREAGKDSIAISYSHINEPPVDRITRMISTYYWDGLTRKMDRQGLRQIFKDPKMQSAANLYVSFYDEGAWNYYSALADELSFRVIRLPQRITPLYVKSLNIQPGILAMAAKKNNGYEPLPFVVPGGRFNEMYGWDSYFINIGLLISNRIDLASAMVENHIYQINHYGKILNANRTYYLTRSQPPFLTSMVYDVYKKLPKSAQNKAWLKKALLTCIKEYHTVWMAEPHITETGLSRYYGSGIGMPPETEADHFDEVIAPYAEKAGLNIDDFKQKYLNGEIKQAGLTEYFIHDRAMRESGHDTSNRLINECANLNTVDLNALLYKYETDIAQILNEEFGGSLKIETDKYEDSAEWQVQAEKRRDLMNRYMWDEQSGQYFDYNFIGRKRTTFQSLTNLYPLWAGMVSDKQAALMVEKALPLYIAAGGLLSTTQLSRGQVDDQNPQRQWDYPNGWAPHQILLWTALMDYGFKEKAQNLAYRWLYMIIRNAVDYNGTIPEKYDVVERSHKVFAEYGNVGTEFAYITREGFGWMNSSFLFGLQLLEAEQKEMLNRLIPPEWLD